MSSDPTNQFGSNQYGSHGSFPLNKPPSPYNTPTNPSRESVATQTAAPQTNQAPTTNRLPPAAQTPPTPAPESKASNRPQSEASTKLAADLEKFDEVAANVRGQLTPSPDFETRCQQAFDVANDLFGNAPTWVCFYRELLGGNGLVHTLFDNKADFGSFLRTDQYHQIQLMLTALRSRDLPENDPNDPQRMITVRLPKSLHEAMCDEAGRLNISVNRLCISRMLQLLDPKMIPETNSKPRGRKPRTRQKQEG